MRIITTAQAAVRAAAAQSDHVRVLVKDSGGTFRDLTTWPGFNALRSVRITESVDSPHRTADVQVVREQFKASLAPWMTSSPLNKGFNPGATAVPLIAHFREFVVDLAVMPVGRTPGAGDWLRVFHGRIDSVNPANGDQLSFGGRDLAGRIADQQIKKERVYSYAQVSGVAVSLLVWQPGISVAVGDYMIPASRGDDDPGFNKFLICSVAGVTGNSEPTWTTGTNQVDGFARWNYVGAPTSAGRPVEQVIQNILNDARATGDALVSLYVPASPGWAITEFLQSRDKALAAVRALANQIGWDARMRWREASQAFEFTLWEPERTKVFADAVFSAGEYGKPTKLETTLENIRNSGQLFYSDTADLWPDGSPKRKRVTASDAASIAKYSEVWFEIQEPTGGNINTATEAQTLINNAVSDMAEPTADVAIPLKRGFIWVEIGDLYAFAADGLNYDAEQKFAVMGFTLDCAPGKINTSLLMRGKPGLGSLQWTMTLIDQPLVIAETKSPAQEVPWSGKKTVRTTPVKLVGGLGVILTDDIDKRRRGEVEYEIHVSEIPGFTPDSSSLKAVVKDKTAQVTGLVPGRMYYGRTVPRVITKNKVARGQPGAQWSIEAARVTSEMLDSLAVIGGPLNGGFEDYPRAGEVFPHWSSGTFGLGFTWTGTSTSVGRYAIFNSKSDLTSDVFRIGDTPYAILSGWARYSEPGASLSIYVTWYGDAGVTAISTTSVSLTTAIGAATVWTRFSINLTPPAGANYARIMMGRNDAASCAWDVGEIQLQVFERAIWRLLQTGFPAPMRVAGGNFDLTVTEGDFRIGNDTHRIKMGIALGGGGAGAGFIVAQGGIQYLAIGSGTTVATQQAIIMSNGVVSIARPAWISLTLTNSWGNYGLGFPNAQYRKLPDGRVELRGLIARGTNPGIGTVFANLPSGYRPGTARIGQTSTAANKWCRIDVLSGGGMTVYGADSASWWQFVFLDGIVFDPA